MQLISDEYRKLNEALHVSNKNYGVSGHEYANEIFKLSQRLRTEDILDYGCGKCTLGNSLPFSIKNYDPAIEAYKADPEPADIVACTDVMEHIEPENLDAVLAHIKSKTKQMVYLSISTVVAKKTLEDGRNAHLIVKPAIWWFNKISEYFEVLNYMRAGSNAIIFGKPVTVLERTETQKDDSHDH